MSPCQAMIEPYRENGQGLVEYALILLAVALVVVMAVSLTGNSLGESFQDLACRISEDSCQMIRFTFDDSDLTGWMAAKYRSGKDAEFFTKDGRLYGEYAASMLFTGYSGDDYTVTAVDPRLETVRHDESQGFSIVFRAEENGGKISGYTFRVYHNINSDHQAMYFSKFVDGKTIWPALKWSRLPEEFDWTQPGDVSIEVVGDGFSAYIGDQLVMQASDDTFQQGSAGLMNQNHSDFSFDGFEIEEH